MLHQTTNLLAQVTQHAAVVVGPRAERATVRSVQLVGLSARHAMVVAVLSNGTIDEPDDRARRRHLRRSHLAAASAHLQSRIWSASRSTTATTVPSSGDPAVDALCALALDALQPESSTTSRCSSAARRRWPRRSTPSTRCAACCARSSSSTCVVSLVRDILDRGLSVAIGAEHGVEPLAACSVVVAPVVVDGEQVGTIGVLGPTRMNYPQALATVEVVSDRLGRATAPRTKGG